MPDFELEIVSNPKGSYFEFVTVAVATVLRRKATFSFKILEWSLFDYFETESSLNRDNFRGSNVDLSNEFYQRQLQNHNVHSTRVTSE